MIELYPVLVPWVRHLAGGVLTIRANQNAERPEGVPYITVQIRSRSYSAPSYVVSMTAEGVQTEIDLFTFDLDINVYGLNDQPDQAAGIMDAIIASLRNHTENVRRLGRGLVFQSIIAGPTDITEQVGEQYQPRFNVEFRMQGHRQVERNVGIIEVVQVSGVFDGDNNTVTVNSEFML